MDDDGGTLTHAPGTYAVCLRSWPTDIDAAALMADGRGADGSDLAMTLSVWCNWSDDADILRTLMEEFRADGKAGEGVSDSDEASVDRGVDGGEEGGDESDGGGGKREGHEAGPGPAGGDFGERSDVHMHLSEVRASSDGVEISCAS